jgi:hypothetical protein
MDGAGNNFLAATGRPGDQHRGVARRKQARQTVDRLHNARVADHSGQRGRQEWRWRRRQKQVSGGSLQHGSLAELCPDGDRDPEAKSKEKRVGPQRVGARRDSCWTSSSSRGCLPTSRPHFSPLSFERGADSASPSGSSSTTSIPGKRWMDSVAEFLGVEVGQAAIEKEHLPKAALQMDQGLGSSGGLLKTAGGRTQTFEHALTHYRTGTGHQECDSHSWARIGKLVIPRLKRTFD